MRPPVILATFLASALATGAGQAAPAAPAPTDRCADADLATLSPDALRILRNEIYARHGRVFKDRILRDTFAATDWYEPDEGYTDAKLTKADTQCLARIKGREAAARKEEQRSLGDLHLADVANLDQFGALSRAHLAALGKHGFVVAPARHEQLFHVYEQNDYLNAPSFITPDAVLQLYHLFFDMTLRQVESEKLSARLGKMLGSLTTGGARLAKGTKQPSLRAAAERNLAYVGVAMRLLKVKGAQVPPALRDAVAKEEGLIKAHQGWAKSPLLDVPVDYSQFIPRGHYTRSETLRRFFLAMMWLGQPPFLLDRDDLVSQMLLLCRTLRDTGADQDWQAIYDVTAFYVGVADDLSPLEVRAADEAAFGPKAALDDYTDAQKRARFTAGLTKRFAPRIVPITPFGVLGPHVRLLGQRFIPDSEVLQKLSDPERRPFPKGLDVMAVLGSRRAKSLLLDRHGEAKAWPQYKEKLEALIKAYARWDEKAWQTNLYTGWLWVLKGLVDQAPTDKTPAFMATDAWASKTLASSLASWAELRHDTLLYAKPSGAECGGKDEEPPPLPEGYVEPQVVFYERMLALLALSKTGLARHQVLPKALVGPFDEMIELCKFLKIVSQKQLAGTARSRPELEQIKIFGANLERLSLAFIDPRANDWGEITSPADRHMAVIADVHSARGNALEVGVGPAYEIFVLVPRQKGGRQLARGAVFSYFEFLHPMNDRLTDEAWQKLLEKGPAPAPPPWTDEFMVPAPVPPPSKGSTTYSSGC